ncbi:hypothetical protein ACHWQZ_G011563 [Mnemiopsis leidyi]
MMRAVLVVTSLLAVCYSLTCYDCTNLENKDYCTTSRECTKGADTCYTLTATKSSGEIFFNLGCGYSDPSGCTCTEGIECDGELDCCADDNCNSKGLVEGLTEKPTPRPSTTPREVKIKTDSPDDTNSNSNKNYTIKDDKPSLEPEVIEGAATGEEPSSAPSHAFLPSVVAVFVLLLAFCF